MNKSPCFNWAWQTYFYLNFYQAITSLDEDTFCACGQVAIDLYKKNTTNLKPMKTTLANLSLYPKESKVSILFKKTLLIDIKTIDDFAAYLVDFGRDIYEVDLG